MLPPIVDERPRCYRCLVRHPALALQFVPAPCGCEHHYCEECIRSEHFADWLRFVGSRCTKSVRAA